MTYDIAIIGGGPAGYMAAERASGAGLSVVLAEKRNIGGVCLNEGCIPTKSFLNSAKNSGLSNSTGNVNHKKALDDKNQTVKTLVAGVESTLKSKKVDVIMAEASAIKKGNSFSVNAGGHMLTARNVLLATGSVPSIPLIKGVQTGLEEGFVLSSREILDLQELPGNLVIIGGGVIGIEMAEYFAVMGCKVTVVEALGAIGGEIDSDAATVLIKALEKKGVDFYLKAKATSIESGSVTIECDEGVKKIKSDKALLCVGRKPVIAGLDALGVLIERGAVATDEQCRTNVAGVYAAGDVNGKYMLAHAAYREAEVCINNIAGIFDIMDYRAIPSVIYTSPEVACVGLSEKQAKNQYSSIISKRITINMSGRHVAEHGISEGFCRLVADQSRGILLGATLVGFNASEIIYSIGLMIQNKIPIESIKRSVFPHPTISEIVRDAIFSL